MSVQREASRTETFQRNAHVGVDEDAHAHARIRATTVRAHAMKTDLVLASGCFPVLFTLNKSGKGPEAVGKL